MAGVHAKMERDRLVGDLEDLTQEVNSAMRQAAVWKVERDQALDRVDRMQEHIERRYERDELLDIVLSRADEMSHLCKQVVSGTCYVAAQYDRVRKEYDAL
jgi:hypothetical protein